MNLSSGTKGSCLSIGSRSADNLVRTYINEAGNDTDSESDSEFEQDDWFENDDSNEEPANTTKDETTSSITEEKLSNLSYKYFIFRVGKWFKTEE